MTIPELVLIALGLAMDCFAVAVSLGACKCMRWRDTLVVSVMFGIFQGLMPIIGWVVGTNLRTLIASVDHWIAFGILAAIGGKMIWQSFSNDQSTKAFDIKNFTVLLTLSVATSIDAMITGITFGFTEVNIFLAFTLITVITFLMTIAGVKIGAITTFIPSRWAEFAGGAVLVIIGFRFLAEHLIVEIH
jgi:putative Mn2+ efflux pump MntP